MSDLIQLLPDHIANQIAAGEVVQRPASVIKEMLENSIDAGATKIDLIIKDAGRTLIQVIDNGQGMSPTDARMSFERHATSKLRKADDLFAITTMGFRGEALASIAAVAQVELKTKREDSELGTQIIIEGSEVKDQSPCACSTGTSIAVKNLFFNIPARRNFLKSDNVEFNHISEEFNRVAIIHPEVAFTLFHNGKQIIQLSTSVQKLRIIALFGNSYQSKLIPIEEKTQSIHISGFIVTPDGSRKTRGDQYFFVNKRYIKHPYLHNAVERAYSELIPQGHIPGYFISIDTDPSTIDINIHPTKTEIKFTDEKLIYGFINACVRKTIGINNLTPSLDFDQEQYFSVDQMPKDYIPKAPTLNLNPNYNPFSNPNPNKEFYSKTDETEKNVNVHSYFGNEIQVGMYTYSGNSVNIQETTSYQSSLNIDDIDPEPVQNAVFQINRKYIVTKIKSGVIIIDQQAAHERILYERYLRRFESNSVLIQQTLFPQTISYSPSDTELVLELKDELFRLGFDMEEFGKNTFIVNGTPSDIEDGDVKNIIDKILENYKNNLITQRLDKEINIALSMSRCIGIKSGDFLTDVEMKSIIDELFACEVSDVSPFGKRTTVVINEDQLKRLFN